MKAQQDIIAPILMVGVLVAVVTSVYMWGLPLIEKNKDLVYLERAESLMREIPDKIRIVASSGGTESILFDLPSRFEFSDGTITFRIQTKGTKYAIGYNHYFTNNRLNFEDGGARKFGVIDPVVSFVYTDKVGEKYRHTYIIKTTPLDQPSGCSYIRLVGSSVSGESGTRIVLRYNGTKTGTWDSSMPPGYDYCVGRPVVIREVEVTRQ